MTASMTDDPAKALLAETLVASDLTDDKYVDYWVQDIAATEPGTRLLAALRDGLAVERFVEASNGMRRAVLFQRTDDAGPDGVWIADADGPGGHVEGSGDTLHAAVAAALAPETSE